MKCEWIVEAEIKPEEMKDEIYFYNDSHFCFTSVLAYNTESGSIWIANRLICQKDLHIPDMPIGEWFWGANKKPTHWMKLPEPPKKVSEVNETI